MGASTSSEVAELQRQKAALTAEKLRLEQVVLAQHWAEKRLQEEQWQKEAVAKWRQEQQVKAESELQRQMKELKIQQRLQREEQQQKEAAEKLRQEQQLKTEYELQRKMDELKMQQRLQAEEQRQMEAAEKLRREEQLKKAEYELQRKMDEMKMQQRLQAEEQCQKEAAEKSRREEQLKKAEYELQRKMDEMKMQQRLQAAEQWQKEATEKLRREEQHKKPEYELQRKVDETKMQQRLQTEQQKILQQEQVSVLPAGNTWASTNVRDTVPVQRVLPDCTAGKPGVTPALATAAPPIHPAAPAKPQTSFHTNKDTVCEPSIFPKAKPQPNKKNPSETCTTRMNASNVRYKEWSIADYVTEENALNKNTAANMIKLLNDNNTVPFIARYRRGMTQGMKEDKLQNVKKSYERAKLIKERAVSVIKTIDKEGRWTPELHAFVHESKSLRDLDRIKSIFKVTKTEDIGLGTIAGAVLKGKGFAHPLCLVDPAIEGLRSGEQVKDGIVCILVDTIKKDIRIYDIIKKLRSMYDMGVETNFAVTNEPVTLQRELDRQKYLPYGNFKATDKLIVHSDISNIRRGEAEKILTVKIVIPPQFSQAFKDRCLQLHMKAVKASPVHKELINAAIDCMYDKWARLSIENWTREEIDEKAEIATMEIIVPYVKQLLLGPALKGQVVIGVVSLSQWVCKLAAVSERGDYLDSMTMNPRHTDNPGARQDAETKLVSMVQKYNCTTLAIGNGAACNENKTFILGLIKKKSFLPLEVSFRVVDEAGLLQQFYSCSLYAAVSVARRLQDPMAEFVKIEPKKLVGKTYQQAVPEKQLTATLNDVIVEAVSSVGVDLNTASAALLRRVVGLDEGKAKSIVEWRDSSGPFTNRNDLMRVKGIDVKTFEQCAGFVRIMPETAIGKDGKRASQDLFDYFDQTSIHPNSYDVAKAILEAAKCNINQFGTSSFIFAVKIFAGQGSAILAKKFGTSIAVIELIVDALTMGKAPIVKAKVKLDEDVNMKSSEAKNLNSKLSFDDLTTETVLTGVVCDIKPFGAFVNVGLGRDGLIHKKKWNGMTLRIGQRVETIVNKIDRERQVFSLKVLKCI